MNAISRQMLAAGAGAAMVVLAGSAAAQTQSAPAGNSAQPQHTIQMVQTVASLDHSLDAKKAKQGDPVTAKLQKDVNIPGQDLPKNTVLEGHVDQVQASEHKSDSTVVVTFDKAKLKGGQEVPIKATVLAMVEPSYMQQQSGGQPAGSGMPASAGASMPASGGGAPQGGGATPSGTAPNAPPPQPMEPAPDAAGTQQQSQRNGVPGVTLQSDIHQKNSATFTSKGKNVHIPDGTEMEFAVAVIPAGVRIQ